MSCPRKLNVHTDQEKWRWDCLKSQFIARFQKAASLLPSELQYLPSWEGEEGLVSSGLATGKAFWSPLHFRTLNLQASIYQRILEESSSTRRKYNWECWQTGFGS